MKRLTAFAALSLLIAATSAVPMSGRTRTDTRNNVAAGLCEAERADAPPAPSAAAPPGAKAKIDQLTWLGGNWLGTSGTAVFEERWMAPAGGVMLATTRTLRDGVMRDFEFLCIVERGGGLVYQAMPGGRQPATDFTLTRIEGNSVTFENEQNSFPKMIRYTRSADGTLEAVISGTEKQKSQTFRFKRQTRN